MEAMSGIKGDLQRMAVKYPAAFAGSLLNLRLTPPPRMTQNLREPVIAALTEPALRSLDDLAKAFQRLGEQLSQSAAGMARFNDALHANCRCARSPQLAAKPHRPILNLPHDPRLRDGRGLHHGYGPKGRNRR